MKTLKLKYENGRYDIETDGKTSVVLDSRNKDERTEVIEQRFLKAVRDKQSHWDTDYGMNIDRFIGEKFINPLYVLFNFEKLLRFYSKTLIYSGDVAIKDIQATFPDATTVQCKVVSQKEIISVNLN